MNISKNLDWYGIPYKSVGDQLVTDCVFCDKKDHLYINSVYGMFDCKKCGETGSWTKLKSKYTPPVQKDLTSDQDHLVSNMDDQMYILIHSKRALNAKMVKKFQIGCHGTDTISFPYYNQNKELVLIKFLKSAWNHDDRRFAFKPVGMPVEERPFFGEQLLNPKCKYCVLTEGEWDTIALTQYGFGNVLSVPTGANRASVEARKDFFNQFQKVYICFDADEKGRKAASEVKQILGVKSTVVTLPHKDANDCLRVNVPLKTIKECFKGITDRSSNIGDKKKLLELYEEEKKQVYFSLGIKKLEHMLKLKPHAFSVIVGRPGHGKTTLAMNIIFRQMQLDRNCFLALFESSPGEIVEKFAQMNSNKEVIEAKELSEMEAVLGDRLYFLKKPNLPYAVEELEQDIRYAVHTYGSQIVVIDNPHKFLPIGPTENERLVHESFITSLCNICSELPIHVFLIVHTRKPSKELFGRVTQHDIKSTGKYAQECDNSILVHREEKGAMVVEIDKSRHKGDLGECTLYLTEESGYSKLISKAPVNFKPKIVTNTNAWWREQELGGPNG